MTDIMQALYDYVLDRLYGAMSEQLGMERKAMFQAAWAAAREPD